MIPLIALAAAVRPATETNAQSSAERSSIDDATAADEATDSDHIDDPGTNRNESLITEDQPRSEDDPGGATLKESVELTSIGNESPAANRGISTKAPSYSGRVETPYGEPIAGAKIWLAVASQRYTGEANRDNREGLLRELGTTDEQGRFEIVLDAVTTQEIRTRQEMHKRFNFYQTQLVATAEGRGPDWMPLDVFEDNPAPSAARHTLQARIDRALGDGSFASRTLKLRPESRLIRGRLVDLGGHPATERDGAGRGPQAAEHTPVVEGVRDVMGAGGQ